jgi:hypothetical protein
LSFPADAGGEAHVLIDCGVLKGTADAQARMRQIAENIVSVTGKRLSALVVTHEHWDHVSGFLQADDLLKELQIDEVWLAWTENADDDVAEQLRGRRAKTAETLEKTVQKLRDSSELGARRTATRIDNVLEFFGAAGRKTTVRGIGWAKERKRREMPYLYPGGEARRVPGTSAVRAYVLGPPRDVKQLKKSDPSRRNSEVYELTGGTGADLGFLAAVASMDDGMSADQQPFDAWFRVSKDEAGNDPFFGERYESADQEWRRIEDDWLGAAGSLALQLDSDTNNTSLALAFELVPSGRVLLFPGDAQVGSWLSWEPLEWTINDASGTRKVTTGDLLERTVLYKVGHHGSHNATLREQGLELMMSPELIALLPVSRETAKKMEWNMPFPSLYRRLREKTRGRVLECDTGMPGRADVTLGDSEWADFEGRVAQEALWIDCWIDIDSIPAR